MGKGNTITTKETFTITVTFDVTDYGPAVLVEIRPKGRFCDVRKDTIVLDGPTFRRMQKRHEGTSWVLCAKDTCRVMTPEYYACYVSGGLPRSSDFNDADRRLAKDPRIALENGEFHLAVRDQHSYDGNFYGLNGRAIPRPIRVDYIYGHLKGSREAMKIIAEKLRVHDQVTEVNVSRIFDMNADFYDQHSIEYLFTPTLRQFTQWGPGSKGHDHNVAYAMIRKLVKCGCEDYGASYSVVKGSAKVVAVNES